MKRRICLMVCCLHVILLQLFQILEYSKVHGITSGQQPLDDPPTFVLSSFGYKLDEVSPQPPLTVEVTVGDPATPGLDITGFEYEVTWFARVTRGANLTRNQKVSRQLTGSSGNDVIEKLGFSISGNKGYKLGDEIYVTFKVRYYRDDIDDSSIQKFSPWSELVTSPSHKTGILVSPTGDLRVNECDKNYSKITITLKTPINCPTNTQNCILGIRIFQERIPGSLFYWTSRQEVALSTCNINLNNSHLNQKFDIYLKGVCDSVQEVDDVILLRFELTQSTYFWNSFHLSDKKIKISDTSSRWCTYQGDPHMKTFDGLLYSYYGIGDFVLYKNQRLKLEINARLWPCASQASCICGIAIREGNDLLVFKGCNINKPWKFGFTFKTASPSSFTSIKVLKELSSNNKYNIFLSNGAILIITHTYNHEVETSWVNAMLRVSGEGGVHQGMCGNYDGIAENDLGYGGDGLNYNGNASAFGESWSLAFNEDSWFKKTPTYSAINQRKMCSCGMRAGWWSESKPRLSTRCSYTEENNFLFIKRATEDITQSLRANARSRRATSDGGDSDQFVDESDSDGEFSLDDFKGYEAIKTLSWPTASGLTEKQVYDYCHGVIFDSSAASECQNVTAKTSVGNNSDSLENCIKDVQITDQKFWSSSALSTFQLQCDEAMLEEYAKDIANETDSIQSDGTQSVLESLVLVPTDVALTCPGDCSGNGSCIQGGCVCNPRRTGNDCSLRSGQVPVLKGIYLDGLCDVRVRACRVSRVSGFGFSNVPGSSLTCHIAGFEVFNTTWNESSRTATTSAQLVDLYQVQCELLPHPVSRDKDAYVTGTPAVGMEISVSNDGRKTSNKQILIVYDGLCLKCTADRSCILKNITCLINGRCYAEGDVHTYETTKSCQPDKNTEEWTENINIITPEKRGRDTTLIIIAGVVTPFVVLIALGFCLRCWFMGARHGKAELGDTEPNTDFFFHY